MVREFLLIPQVGPTMRVASAINGFTGGLRRAVLPAAALAAVLFLLSTAATARTWESHDGKTVEGDFVSVRFGKVRIRRTKTKAIVEIPLNELSERDQEYIEELREKRKSRRREAARRDDSKSKDRKDDDDTGGAGTTFEQPGAWETIRQRVPLLDYLLNTGGGTITIWAAMLFVLHVIFLHISTHLMRFKGHVSDAVKTGILELILVAIVFVGSAGAISVVGEIGLLLLFGVFLTGPIAVLIIYEREFVLSVVAYILSLVLTALANAGFFLVLGSMQG